MLEMALLECVGYIAEIFKRVNQRNGIGEEASADALIYYYVE